MTHPSAHRAPVDHAPDRGIALITALLVLMLISALLVGFTTVIVSDQRYRVIDRDRGRAFYGAIGAIEKQTVDLGNLFLKNTAPTNAQVTALTANAFRPVFTDVTYAAGNAPQALVASELSAYDCNSSDGVNRTPLTVGTNGYTIMFCSLNSSTNPTTLPSYSIVQTGTYAGLMALKTPYQLDATAVTATGGEVHLVRTIEAVAIPVFQFGMFSEVDLAFNSADTFSFGGRVQTNSNLFLSQGAGTTLTLSDKVAAYGEVVRQLLSNGVAITANNDTGTVNMTKGSGTYRAMLVTEGSVVSGPASAQNEPTWHTTSLSTYKGYITNGRTGAKKLLLPLVTAGGANTDLVRRPLAGEDTTSIVYNERLFNKASIRVLLSDTAADITNIPGIDTTIAPLSLEANNTYGGIPIAMSPGAVAGATTTTIGAGSTTSTIVVAAIPTFFQVPGGVGLPATQMTATSGANSWSIKNCTSKTALTVAGCDVVLLSGAGNVPNGATVTGSNSSGVVATTTTTNGVSVGAGKTVNLASTAAFAPQTFWVDDNIATCTGYSTTATPQFTTCTTASAPTNGHTLTTFAVSPVNTSVIGGFIKIERLNASDSTWHDITAEILGYGIGAPSQSWSAGPTTCDPAPPAVPNNANDPSLNAIIRLQHLRDTYGGCTSPTSMGKYDYWPNTLYDFREAYQRDGTPAGGNVKLGGVMHYIAIDAQNLAKWFSGTAPYTVASGATGTLSKVDGSGYSIYISDRRNNRNAASVETGEWGWEDFVNPLSAAATPNGLLDTGEDVNGNGTLETYGGTPNCNGTYNSLAAGGITCASAAVAPVYTTAMLPPSDMVTGAETFNGVGRAMVNRALIFRRAVKMVHGSAIGTYVTGLTVVTENPVYMDGDWNCATAPGVACTGFNDPHAASSVDGDALTLLSNYWNDPLSFTNPYSSAGRGRNANPYYRMAVLAGKGPIFPQPTGTGATFGTDGGAHSFLRFLEGNGPNPDTIHYKGSMATFFYSRQAVGIFKGGGNVYGIPSLRDYTFDTDFQTPAKLPPLTPMFRDMNTVGFSQQLQPGK